MNVNSLVQYLNYPPMNNRYKELFSNALMFTIANLGSKLLVFLMVPLYTAILLPSEFGVTDLISTTVSLLYPIFTICIVDAALRFCFIKEYDRNKILSIAIGVILLGTVCVSLLTLLLKEFDFFADLSNYIFFVPLSFLTTSFSRLMTSFCRGIDKVKYSAIGGVIHTTSIIVFNLLFLIGFKWGVMGYLLSMVLSDIVSISYLSIYGKPWNYLTTEIDQRTFGKMAAFSIPLIPNSLSWWALGGMNRYFLNFYIGISAVGIFSAVMRIPTILTVLSNIFAEAWLLSAIKDYGSNESKSFIKQVHQHYFALLTILTAFIILLSKPLADILLASEYSQHWNLIPFLFVSVFFGALSGFVGSLYSAEKKTALYFVSTLIGSVISLTITVCFLESSGIELISFSIMIGNFFIWLIRRLTIIKYIKIGVSFFVSTMSCLLLFAIALMEMEGLFYLCLIPFLLLLTLHYKTIAVIVNLSMHGAGKFLKH